MTDEEQWRPVLYSSRYSVSSEGRVVDRWNDEIVEPYLDDEGVLSIRIEEDSFRFIGPVIKLMSFCFFGGNLIGLEPYCVDGNDQNVSISNIGMLYEDPKTQTWRPVRIKDVDGRLVVDRRMGGRVQIVETGEVFESAALAAKAVGGLPQNVNAVLKGRLKRHRGHTFRYI